MLTSIYCRFMSFHWVGASSSNCSLPGAMLVGKDQDGTPIFAGRAYHQGDVLPAKVMPDKCVAYIAYNGEEIVKDQFEVLVHKQMKWVWSSGGQVPPEAVVIGNTSDGEPLYLGRVCHDGAVTPGKVHPSHGCCYYPFDGQEKNSHDYEVLVVE